MITNVTDDTVSILKVRDDENWRRAYVNSEDGRAQLKAEFPDAYEELCGDGKPWGTEPTVFPVPKIDSVVQPSPEERIAELEEALDLLLTGVTE